MTSAWLQNPLMKAVRREPAPWTPIWLMRQAGRYLPEYRKLRESVSFADLCKTPDLAAETTVRTVERLGVDAAIVFSDLLLILEPMGMTLEYSGDRGPVLQNPICQSADVERLGELETVEPLSFVLETVQKSRAALPDHLPLIGFAGAPFTLAAYAIEGGSSRDYRRTKTLMYNDTGAWDALMGRLARAITLYVNAQLDAGCQLVQLFDSWAGCLSPDDYRSYVLPHTRSIIESIRPDAPVIHFATGNPALLPLLAEAFGKKKSRPAVVGVDWRIRLDDAWRAIGHDRAIQGNLDPAALLTSPVEIRRRAKDLLRQAACRPGHIFNLGHGVLPRTPVENVLALVEAVHELSAP
ncbi:MAG: uroporphyrinogen decarboxylase [Planctomycetaceae bacterium]|nr:uroporphyrinogen decarboxylase [Planctomycetaceae bacterium]